MQTMADSNDTAPLLNPADGLTNSTNAELTSQTGSQEDVPLIRATRSYSQSHIQQLQEWVARHISKEACAEFLATFVLMMFGIGSVAQHVLSEGDFGDFLSVNISWGIGVALGCYVAGGVSGAHMNPAISLAFAVFGRLPWKKLPVYVLAQMLGSFVASTICFGVYHDALTSFSGDARNVSGPHATAEIWATYNQPFVSIGTGFLDQVVGTMMLSLSIFAITDSKNWAPIDSIKPAAIGATVVAIGTAFGFNTGYAINPARDLAPRLFTLMAGWGGATFTYGPYWFWVPVFATSLGAVIGGLLYTILIESHHPTAP